MNCFLLAQRPCQLVSQSMLSLFPEVAITMLFVCCVWCICLMNTSSLVFRGYSTKTGINIRATQSLLGSTSGHVWMQPKNKSVYGWLIGTDSCQLVAQCQRVLMSI
jgi:hypothetical protein